MAAGGLMVQHKKNIRLAALLAGIFTVAALPAALAAESGAAAPVRLDPAITGNTWASIAKLPDWSGIWELDWMHNRSLMHAVPPKLTPAAQVKFDAYRKGQAEGKNLQGESANCFPVGMPQIMTQPYPVEFLFTPGKVTMIIEAYHEWRHVFTDGRKHSDDPDLQFQGESVGHWEGKGKDQTLVIDTIGLAPSNQISAGIGHSDKVRIGERIRRLDDKYLEITTTITDPEVLQEPWTQVRSYRRDDGELREYECEQNNRDSADEDGRAGLRVEEKK